MQTDQCGGSGRVGKSHFATIVVKTGVDKNQNGCYMWGGEEWWGTENLHCLGVSPQNCLLIAREKIITIQ